MTCTETVSPHYLNHDDPVHRLMYAPSGFNVIKYHCRWNYFEGHTWERQRIEKRLDSGVTQDTPI